VSRQTILIGLDGATFAVLDPMMDSGVMPNLCGLVARGVRGDLISTTPAITPTAWTSLMTGCTPGRHGVMDFVRRDGRTMDIITSRDNACETIWSMVSRQGLRVCSLNFPLMHPPRPVNGYSIPGWVTSRWMRMYSYPKGIIKRLREEIGHDLKALGMSPGEEAKAIEGCSEEEYEDWIKLHIEKDRSWFEVLRHMMVNEPCDLTAVVFDGIDRLQHLCWTFLDPSSNVDGETEWHGKIRELCLQYFRQVDEIIGEIAKLAGPEANLFFASDHGFGPTKGVFYMNAWLNQNGYLKWKNGVEIDSAEDSPKIGVGHPFRYFTMLDWESTMAYVPSGSCSGVYIVRENIPEDQYENFRTELKEAILEKCVHPETGERMIERVSNREDKLPGPMSHLAPDLIVEPVDGIVFSVRASETLLHPLSDDETKGCHRAEGLFAASGPSIAQGKSLEPLAIEDVTPAILYSLGLPVPNDLEGRLVEEVFNPEMLVNQSPVIGEATHSPSDMTQPSAEATDAQGEEEDQREIAARLRALGYMD